MSLELEELEGSSDVPKLEPGLNVALLGKGAKCRRREEKVCEEECGNGAAAREWVPCAWRLEGRVGRRW